MNPVTEISLDEDSFMEMETVQIRGVDSTKRENRAHLKAGAKLVVMERLMTHGKNRKQKAGLTCSLTERTLLPILCPDLWQEMNPGSCSSPTSAEIPDAADTRNAMPLLWKMQRSALFLSLLQIMWTRL